MHPIKISQDEAACYWCGLVESKGDMKTCEGEYYCQECFDEVKDRCKS